MKYVCLVYGDERALREISDPECAQYSASLTERGKQLGGEALDSIETATTVRVREGKVTVTDGPFAETKEQLAGFYLIDAHDLDDALRIASGIPPARVGSIEVRPVRELQTYDGSRSRARDASSKLL